MNTSDSTNTPLPLGFRLRLVDRLIAREFASAFAAEGIGRREWCALNVVAGTSPAPAGPRGHRGGRGIRTLVERGWVERAGGTLTLTDDGVAAKARLDALAADVRNRVAGAVPADDFDTLLRSLDAIARELGWDESQPMPPRPGHGRRHGAHGRHGAHEGHGHRCGEHGFGRHGFGDHGHAHGHPRRRGGSGGHRAAAEAFERGFVRGYEQAQRD